MKTYSLIPIVFCAAGLISSPSCKSKDPQHKSELKEKIDDALDRRPHEKTKDALEELSKDSKEISKSFGEAAKELSKEIKKEADAIENQK